MASSLGLELGSFIAIVISILILNIAVAIVYNKKDPVNKFVSMKIDSANVSRIRYGLLGLILLSWIFSIACTVACTFVKITQTTTAFAGYGSAYSNTPAQSYASYEYFFGFQGADLGNGECTTADIEDDRIRTAFAFAVINNILTTASLIGAPLVMFNVTKDADAANKAWKIIGFLLLASTWCCLFTFYIHQTRICDAIDIECSLGGAGIAQVFNSMLLILICALFFVLPPPASEGGEGNDEDAKKDKNDVEMKEKQVKPQSQHRTTLSRRAKDESDDDEEEGGEGVGGTGIEYLMAVDICMCIGQSVVDDYEEYT